MSRRIMIILAYAVGATAYTLGFEYLGDSHQGLLVFASMIVAISAGRLAPRAPKTEGI